MDFGKRSITVNGIEVELDVNVDLPIADVSNDMDRVASQMAWWGSVWASAEREAAEVDAHYRRWRAMKLKQVLSKDPKLAEWKVKAEVESDAKFLEFKTAAATADENITLARAMFASAGKKANQLQSKGAMQRSELAATGMTTPEEPRSAPTHRRSTKDEPDNDTPDDDARRDKVRGIFRTKGKSPLGE